MGAGLRRGGRGGRFCTKNLNLKITGNRDEGKKGGQDKERE